MKRIICIILTMLMFLLASCGTPTTTSTLTQTPDSIDTTTKAEPTVDLKSISYTVYSDIDLKELKFGDSEGVSLDQNGNEISYSNDSSINLMGSLITSSEKDTEASTHRTVILNDIEYQLSYDETVKTQYIDCLDERYHKLGYAECYTFSNEDVEISARFNKETKELLYWEYKLRILPSRGDFTLEQAIEKSKEYIGSLYGKDVINDYVFSGDWSEQNDEYIVGAHKYVGGYDTSEFIKIYFDKRGRITSFVASTKGLFDVVKDDSLLKEKVQNAEIALNSAIPEHYEIWDTKELIIDANTGKCFLRTFVAPKEVSDGLEIADFTYYVYINID